MVQITQFLRRAVQIRPDGVASECDGRIRTWREFEARAAALAGALAGLGYRPGDRVGMLALNCDRYLEYFFALARGGFVFVYQHETRAAGGRVLARGFRLFGAVRRRCLPADA